MPITIVATPGSASANSFATEAEFIAYTATLAVVPTGTTVSGATCTEAEKKALVMAFRAFNNFEWAAGRATNTQSGAWPQLYALNPDAPSVYGLQSLTFLYFGSTEVPTRVKNGQIELALAIIGGGTVDIFATDSTAGVIEKTVDVLTTRWQPYSRPVGLAKYPQVWAYIGPLLKSGAGSLEMVRV
jgi:hypothetical protein